MATKTAKSPSVATLKKQFGNEAMYAFAPEGTPDVQTHIRKACQIADALGERDEDTPTQEDVQLLAVRKWGPDATKEPHDTSCYPAQSMDEFVQSLADEDEDDDG